MKRSRAHVLVLAALLGAGCAGRMGAAEEGTGADPGAAPPPVALLGAPTGLRRLSRIEYDNTLRDLLGDPSRSGYARLPEDANDPFDNDHMTQVPSGALINAVESLAAQAAARALSDPARRAALVGCAPKGARDPDCLRRFVAGFGRRAFRRPLTPEEVAGFLRLHALGAEGGDFWTGIDLVLRAMLQDPSFLYRVEQGEPVAGRPGIFRLDDFEIATRMSYLLWGSTPSEDLLDRAAAGHLRDGQARRRIAAAMLEDGRGRARVAQFHAFWLGYHQLPAAPQLAEALRAESDALVERVVFGRRDHLELFTAGETFVDDRLAVHYGLPRPAVKSGAWIPYGTSPRRGILSHGSVLSVGAKFDDTSPTVRGIFVRERLLCQEVPPPPPSVAADEPPPGDGTSRCKEDRYADHADVGCARCHRLIDPIGFGLENYDRNGRFRSREADAPECAISGQGELHGVGPFSGPGELGALLVAAGGVEACVVRQLHRFAVGRREEPEDAALIEGLADSYRRKGRRFHELLIDLVASPGFGYRRVRDEGGL